LFSTKTVLGSEKKPKTWGLLKKKSRVLEIEYHWYLNGGRSGGP
jgi:hypothetical protein